MQSLQIYGLASSYYLFTAKVSVGYFENAKYEKNQQKRASPSCHHRQEWLQVSAIARN